MSLDWEAVVAHALALPDTTLTTYYGAPAVKANDRPILSPSHDPGSFCLHMDRDKIEMLKQIDPDTFWQTPHYEGYAALLVRYATDNPDMVLDQIAASRDWAMARPKPKPRKK
ncbi:hypothetical protein [Sphingomonas crusticola]|uniref:hypothetical protein n=1 Tax=Sphingomonas crusticola TaxID=1697973 RepID=UPI000E244206|nr:hypothetical protein [Sphingomonas crusticola]